MPNYHQTDHLPHIGAILTGPHWPDRVRVVRVEPRGTSRVLIEAMTLDGQDRLVSRLPRNEDFTNIAKETQTDQAALCGDPVGFHLAAEVTRIRLARIDPLPHQLEAVYYYMLRQPRLRFLLVDDPGASKIIVVGLHLTELKLRGIIDRILIVVTANGWLKAEQLGEDYWLYIVTEAIHSPSLHLGQDPAHRLPREEVSSQVRYRVAQSGWHQVAEM